MTFPNPLCGFPNDPSSLSASHHTIAGTPSPHSKCTAAGPMLLAILMLSFCTSPAPLLAPLHLELWFFANLTAFGSLLPLAHFDYSSCLYFPFYAHLFLSSMKSVPGSIDQLLCCGTVMLSFNSHSIATVHPCVVGRVRTITGSILQMAKIPLIQLPRP